MKTYVLTVFEKSGKKVLDESFTAENDAMAKQTGSKLLQEHHYSEHTHRCVTSDGRLILFHR